MVTRDVNAQAAAHQSAGPLTAVDKTCSATLNAIRDLTPLQRDVLDFMTQGKSNKGICRSLNLTEPAVKSHVAAILRTLEATSRATAVIKALRASALPIPDSSAPRTYLGYIPAAPLTDR
ncbi:MAG: LuxR C-terminal-related transcriptional regulator [Xanthobacteraceae bacterium]|nr:LuxR C-terminal-related transcriptional regulator [Xanthobacteraceae bacterium]